MRWQLGTRCVSDSLTLMNAMRQHGVKDAGEIPFSCYFHRKRVILQRQTKTINDMMKRYLICLLLGMVSTSMWAKVKLPHLITDNMLLQQQQKVRLWGWDKPGKQVVVVPSWNKKRYTTRTNAQGEWEVEVETPRGSYQTYTLSFDDGEMVKVKNVAIGEVWVCAGHADARI